jgi:DNA invertase Pin-like site-specific DNA recombinase
MPQTNENEGRFTICPRNLIRSRRRQPQASRGASAGDRGSRAASSGVTKVREMKAQGMGASEIAKALKIGRASVYRGLGEGV